MWCIGEKLVPRDTRTQIEEVHHSSQTARERLFIITNFSSLNPIHLNTFNPLVAVMLKLSMEQETKRLRLGEGAKIITQTETSYHIKMRRKFKHIPT